MDKLKNIFHYLKSQDQLSANSYEDFKLRMEDPAKLEKVYSYLKQDDQVESEDFNTFRQNMGFADVKRESVVVVDPKMDMLKTLNPEDKTLSDRMYAELDIKKALRSQKEAEAKPVKQK